MLKTIIITAYIGHKIYWKFTHKPRKQDWHKFMAKGVK